MPATTIANRLRATWAIPLASGESGGCRHGSSPSPRADYIEITRVSPATASRDLKNLVERGVLLAEGRTSSRVYRPSPAFFAEDAPSPPSEEQMRLFDAKE